MKEEIQGREININNSVLGKAKRGRTNEKYTNNNESRRKYF